MGCGLSKLLSSKRKVIIDTTNDGSASDRISAVASCSTADKQRALGDIAVASTEPSKHRRFGLTIKDTKTDITTKENNFEIGKLVATELARLAEPYYAQLDDVNTVGSDAATTSQECQGLGNDEPLPSLTLHTYNEIMSPPQLKQFNYPLLNRKLSADMGSNSVPIAKTTPVSTTAVALASSNASQVSGVECACSTQLVSPGAKGEFSVENDNSVGKVCDKNITKHLTTQQYVSQELLSDICPIQKDNNELTPGVQAPNTASSIANLQMAFGRLSASLQTFTCRYVHLPVKAASKDTLITTANVNTSTATANDNESAEQLHSAPLLEQAVIDKSECTDNKTTGLFAKNKVQNKTAGLRRIGEKQLALVRQAQNAFSHSTTGTGVLRPLVRPAMRRNSGTSTRRSTSTGKLQLRIGQQRTGLLNMDVHSPSPIYIQPKVATTPSARFYTSKYGGKNVVNTFAAARLTRRQMNLLPRSGTPANSKAGSKQVALAKPTEVTTASTQASSTANVQNGDLTKAAKMEEGKEAAQEQSIKRRQTPRDMTLICNKDESKRVEVERLLATPPPTRMMSPSRNCAITGDC